MFAVYETYKVVSSLWSGTKHVSSSKESDSQTGTKHNIHNLKKMNKHNQVNKRIDDWSNQGIERAEYILK